MRARGRTTQHIAEAHRHLLRVAKECDVTRLSDLQRETFDRWLAARRAELMGARNLNAHRVALVAFCNWAISVVRMTSNPFSGIPKADEKCDRRRQRRAMTADELHTLLAVTAQRPLQEAMTVRRGSRKGELTAKVRPEKQEALDWLGRERALIFKTLVLTGLRKEELSSLTVGQLQLAGATPHVVLNPEDEKNRNGTSLPIPDDLANDLRHWVRQKQQRLLRERSTISMTARSMGSKLPSDTPRFQRALRTGEDLRPRPEGRWHRQDRRSRPDARRACSANNIRHTVEPVRSFPAHGHVGDASQFDRLDDGHRHRPAIARRARGRELAADALTDCESARRSRDDASNWHRLPACPTACPDATTSLSAVGQQTTKGTARRTVVASDFAAALAMLATLPLTDDEKADAVRRLLAVREADSVGSAPSMGATVARPVTSPVEGSLDQAATRNAVAPFAERRPRPR